MVLDAAGKMAEFTWMDLPAHNGNIELDEFIVMLNHVHGIIGNCTAIQNIFRKTHKPNE